MPHAYNYWLYKHVLHVIYWLFWVLNCVRRLHSKQTPLEFFKCIWIGVEVVHVPSCHRGNTHLQCVINKLFAVTSFSTADIRLLNCSPHKIDTVWVVGCSIRKSNRKLARQTFSLTVPRSRRLIIQLKRYSKWECETKYSTQPKHSNRNRLQQFSYSSTFIYFYVEWLQRNSEVYIASWLSYEI